MLFTLFDYKKQYIIIILQDFINSKYNVLNIIKYCKSEIILYNNIETEYVFNIKHGYEIEYNKNNKKILSKKLYNNGKLNGKCIHYYNDGKVKSIENFKNNNRDGISIYYSHDGNGYNEILYSNNLIIG